MNLIGTTQISNMSFMESEELKIFREKLGLTQDELAQQLKVARNTVSRWELGERKIPPFLDLALERVKQKLTGKCE